MIPADIPADVQIPAAVGAVLSLVISFILQVSWPSWVKGVVVVVTSVLAGFFTALIRGDLAGLGWLQSISLVWGAAVVAYTYFWKPTGIGPKLEAMTTWAKGTTTPVKK